MWKQFVAAATLAAALSPAHAQVIVQPPPVVVQPPPIVVQPPPVVVEPAPIVIAPPVIAPPPACAAVSYGGLLNLRSWPNGPVLASYWPGTRVLIDGGNGGNWLHVVVGPVTSGWMFAPYLVPVPCGA
jgi:hypothetical protein